MNKHQHDKKVAEKRHRQEERRRTRHHAVVFPREARLSCEAASLALPELRREPELARPSAWRRLVAAVRRAGS